MNSLIIYYSQTGGTKKIAEAIHRGVLSRTGQCDLKHIRDVSPEQWLDYDLVGIGSPIFSSCPVTNVIFHVKALPEEVKGKHAFFFCTHGTTPGRCIIRGVQPMLDKGLVVLGWKDWYSSASLPAHPKPWLEKACWKRNITADDIDLAEAEAFGRAMADHSIQVAAGATGIIPKLHSPEASDEIYGLDMVSGMLEMMKQGGFPMENAPNAPEPAAVEDPFPPKYPSTMDYIMSLEGLKNNGGPLNSNLRVDPELCIGCGRCAKACFCDNIDASKTPPVILSQNCEMCMFCESVCPTGAIQYDSQPTGPFSPQAKGGMMQQEIARAEAKGRFRRIIPVEEVGWDSMWEDVTSHPRIQEIP